MIPLAFDYEVAESVDHAIELLGQHGEEAKLLAGGHSLLPIMKLRLAAPTVLVDLGRIDDLNYVRDGGDHPAIGATRPRRNLRRKGARRRADRGCGRLLRGLSADHPRPRRGAHGDKGA